MAFLEFKDINYSIAGYEVLKGVSGSIEKGEVVFIAGKSGCGKSTLLKISCGLTYPSSGDMVIRGISLKKATNTQLRDLHERSGFVFQDCALISNMTIYENVALPLRYHNMYPEKEIHERVMQALSDMELDDDINNRPAQLSLGERKLATLARTLITDPDLIYFDEPLASLDSKNVKKIVDILLNLVARKKTIVLISHRLRLMRDIGNKLWIINDGKIHLDQPLSKDAEIEDQLASEIIER